MDLTYVQVPLVQLTLFEQVEPGTSAHGYGLAIDLCDLSWAMLVPPGFGLDGPEDGG